MDSRTLVSFLLGSLAAIARAQSAPPTIPSRVAEEAEALQQNAARILTRESLDQRSLLPPTRFTPRAGSAADRATGPRFRIRDVVSEFTFGPLRGSPTHYLVEFRQVLAVDGVPQQSDASAVHSLSEALRQGDDLTRKRMVEDFARNGLVDIATDYSLILLAFTARGQKQLDFSPAGAAYIGVDAARAIHWKQTAPQGGALDFHGKESAHRALEGTLYVRASDGLPLRISSWVEYKDRSGQIIREEATVDYIMSEHGFLTPASVIHRHVVNGAVITENLYRYEPFKLFATESTISFGTPK